MAGRFGRRDDCAGFTLIELLVVVGIIAILVSILIPAAALVRKHAMKADTAAEISRLQTAIQFYFQEFNSYPGPIAEPNIYGYNAVPGQTVTFNGTPMAVSSSENLVLGLSGGLSLTTTTPVKVQYDPTQIARGPVSLNALNPRQYKRYFDANPRELPVDGSGNLTSWTQTVPTGAGGLQPLSTPAFSIPEYLDHFTNPRPIIYLRAITGASGIADNFAAGPAPTYVASAASNGPTPYYSTEMSPYWVGPGGIGGPLFANPPPVPPMTAPPSGYSYTDAYTFFQNPSQQDSPKNKDSFILISAGYDGIYGTPDDVMYPPN